MKAYFYTLLCLLIICTTVQAQGLSEREVDSLWQLINTNEVVQDKDLSALYKIAENSEHLRDSVIVQLQNFKPKKTIEKAQKSAVLGEVFYLKNRLPEAEKATKKSLVILEKLNTPQELIQRLKIDNTINLGRIEKIKGEHQGAIAYLLKALKLNEGQYFDVEYIIHSEIGYVYDKFEKHEEALRYFEKALDIAIKHQNRYKIAEAYHGLGQMASNLYELERADSLYQLSLSYVDTTFQRLKHYGIYCSQAMVKEKKKEFTAAIPMFKECIKFYKKEKNMAEFADMNLHLGYIARTKGEYKESAFRCQIAYQQFRELGHTPLVMYAAGCMGDAYNGLKDYEKAFRYNDKHWTLYDSLLRIEKQVQVTRQIGEAERTKDQKIYDEQLKRRNTVLGFLSVLLLLAFFAYRIKTRDNRKINAQRKQLEQLNQTKDRIFGIIGHDLKKPAIAFRGIAKKVNYLLKKQDYDRLLVLGESIEKDANELNILTDNLLKWALLQRNILSTHATETDIQPIVEEVFSLFDRVAAEKNINLTTNIQPKHKALADKNALSTIIRNLVDNAVKFTPNGGEVKISTTETKAGLLISIRDTGVGMPQDKIKGLFLLKKEKTTEGTDGEKGTGLGLYLVGELIKQNKGTIEITSQEGQGTEFKITLPVAA